MTKPLTAIYRRLSRKFISMILVFSVTPLLGFYFYAVNAASEMRIGSLRDGLKEKSFLTDMGRFFEQHQTDIQILSQAGVLEISNTSVIIQYLTEIIRETPRLDGIDIIDVDGTITDSSGEQNEKGQKISTMLSSLSTISQDTLNGKQGDV